MKALKIVLILLIVANGANAQFIKADLQISGLNCALCAKTTERALRALPYVGDVKPDLMRNLYVITFKNGQPVNFDEIGRIVKEENFFVTSLKATVDFDNLKVTDSFFNYGGDSYQVMNAAGKQLSGQVVVTIVDKGLAPRSVSKKYLGQAGTDVQASSKPGRLYHVAI